jgi:hypothetical protein
MTDLLDRVAQTERKNARKNRFVARSLFTAFLYCAAVVCTRPFVPMNLMSYGLVVIGFFAVGLFHVIDEYRREQKLKHLPLIIVPLGFILFVGLQKVCDDAMGLIALHLVALISLPIFCALMTIERCEEIVAAFVPTPARCLKWLKFLPVRALACSCIWSIGYACGYFIGLISGIPQEVAPIATYWVITLGVLGCTFTDTKQRAETLAGLRFWWCCGDKGGYQRYKPVSCLLFVQNRRRMATAMMVVLGFALTLCMPAPGYSENLLDHVITFLARGTLYTPQGQHQLIRAALCFLAVAPLPPLMLVACYAVVSTEPVSQVRTRLWEDHNA